MTIAGFRNSVVSSTTGLPVSGATVTVTVAGTSDPADIYSDKNATTPIVDLATDASGFFEFYASAGTYDVMVSLGVNSVVWNDIAIGTMQAADYTRVWRTGLGDEDLDAAISSVSPVLQSASAWAADNSTILLNGQWGIELDTGLGKYGNGEDVWGDLGGYTFSIATVERGLDGRTILEASPVTDASAEFLPGATFELDPTNARHYNIQVGDSSTALTANMVIDLVPDSTDWPDTAKVIITKGDATAYTATVSGLDADGLGTYALTEQYEGVILGYHHTDDDDGPGAAGQKWKVVARFTRTRQQDIVDYVETNAHLKTDGNLLPDGTLGIVTLDDAGDPVVSQTSGDGTIQVSPAGLVTAVAKLGATTYPWTDITASRNLSSADAWFSITTGSAAASYLSFQTLQVNPDPKSTPIALGIPNDLPTGDYLIFVPGDQTGAVTLTIVDAATINGDTNTVTLYAGRYTLLKVYNGGSAPEVQTSPTLDDGLGIAVSASGTLPLSYAGYTVLTSGGVTIPTTIGNGGRGLHGVLRGGGAHTVTFNSSTYETLAAGDIFPFMVIDVSSTPTLIGKKIAAADLAAP